MPAMKQVLPLQGLVRHAAAATPVSILASVVDGDGHDNDATACNGGQVPRPRANRQQRSAPAPEDGAVPAVGREQHRLTSDGTGWGGGPVGPGIYFVEVRSALGSAQPLLVMLK